MDSKILLIGNTSSRSALRLKEESISLGCVFDMVKPLNIFLHDDELTVQNTELRFHPMEYDSYFFRGIGRSEARMQEIASFLHKNNKRVIEKKLAISGLPEDKLVPKSLTGSYAIPEQLIISSEQVTKDTVLKFPVVVKKASSSMGKGVTKVQSVSELLSLTAGVKERIFIQKYYPIEFDIRILIVGDKVIGGLARYKPAGEDFLTTRRGGERKAIPLTEAMIGAASEAKKLHGLEIAGVDLFMHDDKPYIFEVNASPQIFVFEKVTGENAALEILQYLGK